MKDFSETVQRYFEADYMTPFPDWKTALDYVGRRADSKRAVLIVDEFPFMAAANPSLKSILQHQIDHDWKDKNIFLILCGSSVSFMVKEVMGYKSPLYGRITGSVEVSPFDYLESAEFFPDYSEEDKLIAYGILGGVPRYLNAFDPSRSVRENIERELLTNGAFLYDEPQTLLRMELREPLVYNSILESVSNGCNRIIDISNRIHEEKSKCSKYMLTLQSIRLLEKRVPCGKPADSKKGIYEITDNFYKFWYRWYVFSRQSYYGMLGTEAACEEILKEMNDYMAPVFEQVCQQYLVRQAKAGKLPFVPYRIGKWWGGTNPQLRRQDDVDVLAMDKSGTKAIFCECKFRNRPMPMEEYEDLLDAAGAFPEVKEKYLIFISKSGYTAAVERCAREEGAWLLTLEDLFKLQPK